MKNKVNLTINDKEIAALEGTLLIEAAKLAGVDIPHLCYCESLASTGSCRLCMVEVEGAKGLIASCTQKVKEGMKITTDSDKISEARRFVVDLILSNHPGDCLSCDKNGICELQKYAYELEIDKTSFSMKDQGYAIDRDNPFFERNYNLCILCGRCVRICKKQSGDVIDFVKRGMMTKVATAMETGLLEAGCDFCGSCVAVCPTAALMERDRRYKGREWEMESTQTTCSYCGAGCKLIIDSAFGAMVRARTADPADFICTRGRFGFDYAASPKRIKSPMIKKNGKLKEVSYDEAIKFAAERLKEIKKAKGTESIGGFIGATETNEAIYLFQKMLRSALGTNNIDSPATFLGAGSSLELFKAVGQDALATHLDLETADFVIALSDGISSYPRLLAALRRAASAGAKVVTIGSGETDKRFAALTIKEDSEGFALLAIAKAMADDKEALSKLEEMVGFAEFKKVLTSLDDKSIEKETSARAQDFSKVAAEYLAAKNPVIAVGSEMLKEENFIMLLTALLALGGRFKSSILVDMALANLRGALSMGAAAGYYPGPLNDDDDLRAVMEIFGTKLPKAKGMRVESMIEKMGSDLAAFYLIGDDLTARFDDGAKIKKALGSLDFLMVQDSFMTGAAEMADLIIPKRSSFEEEGTYVSYDGSLSQVSPAISSDLKSTIEVISDLSTALGFRMKSSSPKEIEKEFLILLNEAKGSGEGKVNLSGLNPKAIKKPGKEELVLSIPSIGKFGFYDESRILHSKLGTVAFRAGSSGYNNFAQDILKGGERDE